MPFGGASLSVMLCVSFIFRKFLTKILNRLMLSFLRLAIEITMWQMISVIHYYKKKILELFKDKYLILYQIKIYLKTKIKVETLL